MYRIHILVIKARTFVNKDENEDEMCLNGKYTFVYCVSKGKKRETKLIVTVS